MKGLKVVICGGGTAGHLYPGLALSQKLKEKEPEITIVFVGSSREIEKKIMKHHKVHFISLKIEGIKGKGMKMIKSLLILPYSGLKSLMLLLRIKPRLVIGLGGYSSGPVVLIASWMGVPTLILEQNLYPGFTNRMLLPWIQKAVVAFENSLAYFKGKGIYIGNPAREEFYSIPPKQRNSKLSILIFGGSQGSHFINKGITNSLPLLKKERENLKISHQTGNKDFQWVKNSYAQNDFEDITIAPYFFNMAHFYQKSDLIVCRSGATTIAELIASQRASLLIPFSQATDNHQVLNARELEKIKGAEIILENQFSPEYFAKKVFSFLKNKERIDQMEANMARLKTKETVQKISDLCFELIEQH